MKGSKVVYVIILFTVIFSSSVCYGAPRDIQYHPAGQEINTLIENDIIRGYEDGRFKPDRHVTGEEFCYLLVTFGKSRGFITEEMFEEAALSEDVSYVETSWSKDYVKFIVSSGIIDIHGGSTFRPKEYLTRETMAEMIYHYKANIEGYVFSRPEDTGGVTNPAMDFEFTDISNIPGEEAVKALKRENIINGYEDKTFRPKNNITRGEVSIILYRMSEFEEEAMEINLPKYNLIDVPYISQVYPVSAYVGCEGAALLMGLRGKGYAKDIDLRVLLDNMPKHSSNPARGFVGSPYKPDKTKKTRTTIYPSKLAEYGKTYGKVSDFSGSSVHELQAEILAGNPVVVYATMNWEKPFYRKYNVEGEIQTILSNNHVVLVTGYDMANHKYFICDPYNIEKPKEEFKYWVDGETFDRIYNERRHAVVIE